MILFFLLLSLVSGAVIDFSQALCGGAPCQNDQFVDHGFGSLPGLDVVYSADLDAGTAGTIAPRGFQLRRWGAGYSDLNAGAFGSLGATIMNQICLMVVQGSVTVQSFALGAFTSDRTIATRVYDAAGGPALYLNETELVRGTVRKIVSGPWTSTTGICLQLGPDLNNGAIGSIDFTFVSAITTGPPTVLTTTGRRGCLFLLLNLLINSLCKPRQQQRQSLQTTPVWCLILKVPFAVDLVREML